MKESSTEFVMRRMTDLFLPRYANFETRKAFYVRRKDADKLRHDARNLDAPGRARAYIWDQPEFDDDPCRAWLHWEGYERDKPAAVKALRKLRKLYAVK